MLKNAPVFRWGTLAYSKNKPGKPLKVAFFVLGELFHKPKRRSLERTSRGRLWTVFELRRVEDNCRASTLRTKSQLYFLPVWFLGTREEESRPDNQEHEDIDGTGEVER